MYICQYGCIYWTKIKVVFREQVGDTVGGMLGGTVGGIVGGAV